MTTRRIRSCSPRCHRRTRCFICLASVHFTSVLETPR
ncbi:hypothetical protein ebA6220 [Aromatoleum aromaticum EbN1]|uniref:Uncharacterized protein n=1 Tax=Aromatoleum aromaticum (strain DSM 19018 / LMG 30748 / EbN1) TaxID=76114 RepID=Q5NZ35_AROAE|nr:hypothetical protein ebA6220 [Aromatoleum aromaticum EbN1]